MLHSNYISTTGIVSRLLAYRGSRALVTLLTPDSGVITASLFTNKHKLQLDMLQHISFTAHKRHEFLTIRDFSVTKDYTTFARDLYLFGYANYFTELAHRTIDGGTEQFQLLTDTFDALPAAASKATLCRWYEYHTIRISGVAPLLTSCIRCDKPLTTDAAVLLFDAGGVACQSCIQPKREQAYASVSAAALAMLETLATASVSTAAQLSEYDAATLKEVAALLSSYIKYKLNITTKSAKVFADIISAQAV